MTTNFNKIKQFHLAFGHPVNDTHQTNVFDDDIKLVKLRLDLIKEEVKELEELLGMPQMNPYGTLHRDVFKQRLEASSASDLTDLAARVGIPRERNMNLLRKSLIQSFDYYVQKHNVTVQGSAKPILDPSSPDYDSTVKLFKDGF